MSRSISCTQQHILKVGSLLQSQKSYIKTIKEMKKQPNIHPNHQNVFQATSRWASLDVFQPHGILVLTLLAFWFNNFTV